MLRRPMISNIYIQQGRLLGRRGHWEKAEESFARAIATLPSADAYYYLGNSQFQLKKHLEALASTERSVSLDGKDPARQFRLGALYERAGRHEDALKVYSTLLEMDPDNADLVKRLARTKKNITASQPNNAQPYKNVSAIDSALEQLDHPTKTLLATGEPWKRLAYLEQAEDKEPSNPLWPFHRALTELQLGRISRALESFSKASTLSSGDHSIAFHQAWALLQANESIAAQAAIDRVLVDIAETADKRIKPGAFFQSKGLWPQAARLYAHSLEGAPSPSDSYYRTGVAHERMQNWAHAENFHYQSLILEPETASRHFRYGITLERQDRFEEAAEAYAVAIRLSESHEIDWVYRHASSLNAAGKIAASLTVFTQLFPRDEAIGCTTSDLSYEPSAYEAELLSKNLRFALTTHDPRHLYQRGVAFLRQRQFDLAITALQAAVRQESDHQPEWYFRLALAQMAAGHHSDAIDSFLNTRKYRAPLSLGNHGYFKKQWQEEGMDYVEYSQSLPLEQNTVLFESYLGNKIDCNPAAIYRELSTDPRYANLRFVWVVGPKTPIPADVAEDPRVSLVRNRSDLYRRVLATAKYLVSNVSFAPYFVRREGQKYLNTWHGTPLKALGKDITSGFMPHGNIARNFIQSTHLLAPNKHTHDSLISGHDIEGVFTGKVARLGTPRIDRMLAITPDRRSELFAQLGLTDDGRDVIFYAPTWRGSWDNKHFDREKLVNDLSALAKRNAHVVFRAHRLTEALLKGVELEVTLVPADIDSYDVLGIADVLITDYSSIFFDFLPARRPIVFYAYDLDEYVAERGLYFLMAEMPGEIARTIDELGDCLNRAAETGIQDQLQYDKAIEEFAPREQAVAARRAISFLFEDDDEFVVEPSQTDRKMLLFRHNFMPGAGTDSLLELASKLDPADYRVIVQIDRGTLQNSPERQAGLNKLPDHVQVLLRSGAFLASIEERWVINSFNKTHQWANEEQERIFRQAFEREFRRTIGTANFDAVIQLAPDDLVGRAMMASSAHHAKSSVLTLDPTLNPMSRADTFDITKALPVAGWYDHVITDLADHPVVRQP